jgi:hypothetical protein
MPFPELPLPPLLYEKKDEGLWGLREKIRRDLL